MVIIPLGQLEEMLCEKVDAIVTNRLKEFFDASRKEQEQEANKNLSVSELCERWSVSKGTVSNYVKAGMVAPIKLNRQVLFPLREVLRAEGKYLKLRGGR